MFPSCNIQNVTRWPAAALSSLASCDRYATAERLKIRQPLFFWQPLCLCCMQKDVCPRSNLFAVWCHQRLSMCSAVQRLGPVQWVMPAMLACTTQPKLGRLGDSAFPAGLHHAARCCYFFCGGSAYSEVLLLLLLLVPWTSHL
jgi:hypothetical protein